MHSNLYEETRNEYENIKEMMSYYVPVSYFQKIIEHLTRNHYLLITGKAGIGKTSLARAIVAYFTQKEGYQFLFTRNVHDANAVYKENQKQIFFFDDFWGSSLHDLHYDYNDERSLKTLIEKIEKSPNKILILTTRDYVLKYGLAKNLDLEDTLTQYNYILDIDKYSLKLRLDILLSHLYKSNVPYHYLEELLSHLEDIIRHENFNPRIVESYLESEFYLESDKYKFSKYFIESFDNPDEFLYKLYKRQTKEAKLLLFLLLSVGGSILVEELKELYLNALRVAKERGIDLKEYDIEPVIDQLEKNFVKTRYIQNCGTVVSFLNPSIPDFLYEESELFHEFDFIVLDSILYLNQFLFFMKEENKRFTTEKTRRYLFGSFEKKFAELRLIRGDFIDTLPFEQMSLKEQLIYKIKNCYYAKDFPEYLKQVLIPYANRVLDSFLQKSREYIFEDDLTSIITIFKFLLPYQELDGKRILETYYELAQYAYELYLIKEFEPIFKKEYKKMKQEKKEDFLVRLKNMIYKDLADFYEQKRYQALRDLQILLEEELFDFIKDDEELLEQKEFYELPDSYFDEQDQLLEIEFDKPEVLEDVKDIQKYALHYLHMEKDFTEQETIKIKKTEKKLYDQLQEESHEYLETFLESDALPLILSFYKEHPKLAERVSLFCQDLILYALKKENLETGTSLADVVLIGFATLWENEMVFTLDTLKRCEYTKNLKKENLEKILNSDLFIRQGKWISFVHPCIQIYCMAVALLLSKEEDKKEIYEQLVFSYSPLNQISFAFDDYFNEFCKIGIEVDSEGFKEYFLKSYVRHFLNDASGQDERGMVNAFFKFFCLTLHFKSLNYKDLENCGYSYIEAETHTLFECFFGYFSFEAYITPKAFITFKEKFKKQFYKEDRYTISIDLYKLINNDLFYDWLEQWGLKDAIVKFYQKVKQLDKLFTKVTYSSFKEYAEALEKEMVSQK